MDGAHTALPQVQAHAALQEHIQEAAAQGRTLHIQGHGSKSFYGHAEPHSNDANGGQVLNTQALRGITAYEPSELYITALAGTPITELEALLATQQQCLAFEPPRFAGSALGTGTVGGMVAAGLSGPARARCGAVRDHVLGLSMINGRGEVLQFGGTVIKNVAGYDVSRLMAGSLGVLGLITEVSLKVMPRPVARTTLRFEQVQAQALSQLQAWGRIGLPVQASAWWDGALVVRLAGAEAAVRHAQQQLGGDAIPDALADAFWDGLRDQRDEFFVGAQAAVQGGAGLWRLSLPPTAPALPIPGEQLIEWDGAQRWVVTPLAGERLRETCAQFGGHATLFRAPPGSLEARFSALSPVLMRLHQQLKTAFDPHRLFNPGRLYAEL